MLCRLCLLLLWVGLHPFSNPPRSPRSLQLRCSSSDFAGWKVALQVEVQGAFLHALNELRTCEVFGGCCAVPKLLKLYKTHTATKNP